MLKDELCFVMQVANLEIRLQESSTVNKELTDTKYRLEASVRELGVKLKTAEGVSFGGKKNKKIK